LQWDAAARALAILVGCATVFAAGGALAGWVIGVVAPGYYRGVVSGARLPGFNPLDVGIGLGCAQGVMLGVIVGTVVVLGLAWRQASTKGDRAGTGLDSNRA
jgi:hypothetical protein